MNHYRNKRTGEFRDVEPDSREQFVLQREVGPDGRPVWEQTGAHHAQAVKVRAAHGELDENDLGQEHQENLTDPALLPDAGPEFAPHEALTPGEIESGQTPEQKAKDLADMFDTNRTSNRTDIFDEAAEGIADEPVQKRAAAQAGRMRARSGGSEDVEDNPRPNEGADGSSEGDDSGSSSRSRRGGNKKAKDDESEAGSAEGSPEPVVEA